MDSKLEIVFVRRARVFGPQLIGARSVFSNAQTTAFLTA
jgi:hypothetical protein